MSNVDEITLLLLKLDNKKKTPKIYFCIDLKVEQKYLHCREMPPNYTDK